MSASPTMAEVAVLTPFSTVAAGHAASGGSPLLACSYADGVPRKLLKPFDEMEFNVYLTLADEYSSDPIRAWIPSFHGTHQSGDSRYISLGNLLHGFKNPRVMDVKMGIRTFVESESQNKKLRKDLYQKMTKSYPAEVTDSEHEAKGVTKFRWMSVHDKNSTTRSLGYRICGATGYQHENQEDLANQFEHIMCQREASEAFYEMARDVACSMSTDINMDAFRVASNFHQQLSQLRAELEKSKFFARHECIGTSLLLVADASGKTGVYWIDFAKTKPLDKQMSITHRKAWEAGNHEDGILCGIDNMISSWDWALQMLHTDKAVKAVARKIEVTADSKTPFECTPNPVLRAICSKAPKHSRSKSVHQKCKDYVNIAAGRKSRRYSTVASISPMPGVATIAF
jgi:1D-myo-inositol-triphosphate 3-kinase